MSKGKREEPSLERGKFRSKGLKEGDDDVRVFFKEPHNVRGKDRLLCFVSEHTVSLLRLGHSRWPRHRDTPRCIVLPVSQTLLLLWRSRALLLRLLVPHTSSAAAGSSARAGTSACLGPGSRRAHSTPHTLARRRGAD